MQHDSPSVPRESARGRAFHVKSTMAILVSLIVLVPSVWIVLDGGYNSDAQKWAFGSAGTVLGFWLHGLAD